MFSHVVSQRDYTEADEMKKILGFVISTALVASFATATVAQ